MPVTGTGTASGNLRTSNLGGFSGWGVFSAGGVAADNTYAYALYSNVTNPSVGGGLLECHLVRTPWATWTVAATTILTSFTRTLGAASSTNALGRRPSDGLLAGRLNSGDLYTFDPGASYAANRLGDAGGGAPASPLLGVAFDPTTTTIVWTAGYSVAIRRWQIGTGDLGSPTWAGPVAMGPVCSLSVSPGGTAVGAATWDISNSPKGVLALDLATGLTKAPLGLRWLATDQSGAGNGNHTEGTLANRAAVSNCRDACMDLDGLVYAISTVSAALGIRRLTADWLTADAISTVAIGTPNTGSHIAVSPDGTKLVASMSEQLLKVT